MNVATSVCTHTHTQKSDISKELLRTPGELHASVDKMCNCSLDFPFQFRRLSILLESVNDAGDPRTYVIREIKEGQLDLSWAFLN